MAELLNDPTTERNEDFMAAIVAELVRARTCVSPAASDRLASCATWRSTN